MGKIDHKDYIINDDGTIIRFSPDERPRKEKIEKLRQRINSNKSSNNPTPNQLLEKARRLYYNSSDREDEAMAIFYRPDVQSLMDANDCFEAGIFMFKTRHDLSEARRWYQRAVDVGGMDAKLRLAHMLSYGENGMPEDVGAALEIYANGVDQCNAKAEETMGDIYMNGYLGIEVNYSKAEEMYRRSAVHGNKYTDYPLNKINRLKELKKWSSERLLMQIDYAISTNQGARITGRIKRGSIQVGDCVYLVDKNASIELMNLLPSQIKKNKKKQSVIVAIEITSMEIKEPHGNKGIPGDNVRVLLRGVLSKEVEIGDFIIGI